MRELVFLLEEPSAAAMLEVVATRLAPAGLILKFIPFEGKQDLERQLVMKLKGYRNPLASFVVLRDQDSNPDCKAVKKKLAELCSRGGKPNVLVRIACRELESFYLADLGAVEEGLGLTGLVAHQQRAKFRQPDNLTSPAKELAALTKGRHQKVAGSRAIAPHLDLENSRSSSFRSLISGIRRMVENPPE